MKLHHTLILVIFISSPLFAQTTDTLKFYSKAFEQERTIFITTPEFYKYQSEEVKLPVIYILDGQHEWFVNPLLNSIKYLQYTHQIPQAILVTIPLLDRYKECGIKNLTDSSLPLHQFITKEVDEKIKPYHPNEYKVLVGHSFSASFALYSYLKAPSYYSAIIANTPLDSFKEMVMAFENDKSIDKSKISISIGGNAENEDFYHRKSFDTLKSNFPLFFDSISIFIADKSGHTAVPIVTNPYLLTKLFAKFKDRYSGLAKVNDEYLLVTQPNSVNEELSKIENASKVGDYFYPPEIADLNGLASRYLYSDLNLYGIAVYEMAVKYYPKYYDFHLQLYELYLPTNIQSAKNHLDKAYELLNTVENDLPEKQEELINIHNEKKKNGW